MLGPPPLVGFCQLQRFEQVAFGHTEDASQRRHGGQVGHPASGEPPAHRVTGHRLGGVQVAPDLRAAAASAEGFEVTGEVRHRSRSETTAYHDVEGLATRPTGPAIIAPMEVREYLRQVRIERGITVRGLAKKIGISHTALVNWEGGGREPTDDDRRRWGASLGFDVQVIVRPLEADPTQDPQLTPDQRALLRAVLDLVPQLSDAESRMLRMQVEGLAKR